MKDLSKFTFDHGNRYIVLATLETYTRTTSGRTWKSKPTKTEHYVYTEKKYQNYVSATPFFNRLGQYSRAHYGYTAAGYIPTRIISVNPSGDVKNVAHFHFVNTDKMRDAAGYRENAIIDGAREFSVEYYHETTKNGGRMYGERITLYTDSTGDTCSGIFDTLRGVWVN